MPSIACVNGAFSSPEAARVPIDDRGYLFGDGVYETMRTYAGRIWAFERHLLRLRASLEAIAIPTAVLDPIRAWTQECMGQSLLQDALVYVQVTRGVAPRKHTFDETLQPTVVVTVRPFEPISGPIRATGVAAIAVEDIRWGRRDIKCINLLPNVLAKQQAAAAGAFEAILYQADAVTEGSSTNVFAVRNNEVWTAPADHHILGGVTRDLVLAQARGADIHTQEMPFMLDWLRSADEVFLSGTTTEVLGVTTLDGRPVNDGSVGPITRRLHELFEECVRNHQDCL